jgi:hypothetical protein
VIVHDYDVRFRKVIAHVADHARDVAGLVAGGDDDGGTGHVTAQLYHRGGAAVDDGPLQAIAAGGVIFGQSGVDPKPSPSIRFDFYGRLTVTVWADDFRYRPVLRIIGKTFGAFRPHAAEEPARGARRSGEGAASLDIRLGRFEPDLNLSHVVDEIYHVSPGRVYAAYRHKFARWRAEVSGLDDAATTLRIDGNIPSYLVFPFETVFQLVLYKLGTQGLVFLHALGVARGGRARLLIGRSGIGKSLLGGKHLRDGWALLGDDMVFVDAQGLVRGFQLPIGLRSLGGSLREYGLKLDARDRARYLFAKVVKILTLGHIGLLFKIEATRLGKDKLAAEARAGAAVFAQPGAAFSLEKVPCDENFIDQVDASARFEAVLLGKLLDAYCYVFPKSGAADFWERRRKILGEFLSGAPAFAARIPSRFDDSIYPALEQGLGDG